MSTPTRYAPTVLPIAAVLGTLLSLAQPAGAQQAPGWSRGQQNLAISYDECLRRASAALQTDGYRTDYAAGDFVVGIKQVHTAVIICSPAPEAKMLVHVVVASNGGGGGSERQRLQALMERSGAASPNLAGGWICTARCAAGGEGKRTGVSQNGRSLTFTNENGQSSAGRFEGATTVVATDWGNLVATIARDGRELRWANGTIWSRQ